MSNIPPILLSVLHTIEPEASFTGTLPRISSSSSGKTYYAKLGSARSNDVASEQFAGEATSLNVFNGISPGLTPNVLAHGVDESSGKPYMISNYLDLSGSLSASGAKTLAKRLATEVHAHSSPNGKYGFDVPTFCGATRFDNTWCDTWAEAYGGMIQSLLDRIGDAELNRSGKVIVEKVIPYLLGERLEVKPSFLHGDLWSGNVGTLSDGSPVIYDPSSYYGHNEADLAIARIFGGFPSSFFDTYHSHFPKSNPVEEYEERAELYKLFHYLNHTLLFGGGGYKSSSLAIMRRLAAFADREKL